MSKVYPPKYKVKRTILAVATLLFAVITFVSLKTSTSPKVAPVIDPHYSKYINQKNEEDIQYVETYNCTKSDSTTNLIKFLPIISLFRF